MRNPGRTILLVVGCLLAIAAILHFKSVGRQTRGNPGPLSRQHELRGMPASRSINHTPAAAATDGTGANALPEKMRRSLETPDVRRNEAILTFRDEESYRRFLDRARSLGLTILGRLDALRSARVKYDSLDELARDMRDNPDDYLDAGANASMHIPGVPPAENRAATMQVPLGNTLLSSLGIKGDQTGWGKGVTIAVIDSGVAPDATFGKGRLSYLDVGFGGAPGTGADDGHGTAVASLAAGMNSDAIGVAPYADIVSIRVTGADGLSDTFTVAQAILAAADAGAQVINISLGAYSGSSLLTYAIDYATSKGAVITAAAGNDQAAQLTWPAADPRVISVGAVDALEQQVLFSNSGDQLQITAPGYGIQTAWLDGDRVLLSGTSASAPIVAGAIAALMSQSPGLTAQQAWEVLRQYTNEAGAPGTDPDYGNGVLNVGWAMNRGDVSRVDTAVAAHYYDATAGEVDIIVQNRGGQGVSGLQLDVTSGDQTTSRLIPWLPAGATSIVRLPVDASNLSSGSGIQFRSVLTNPAGLVDQNPANNRKVTVLRPASGAAP